MNNTFGLGVSNTGRLMVQAWGSSNDFRSSVVGTGQGWLLQSAVLGSSSLSHYLDGVFIGSKSHAYATTDGSIVLGAEIDGAPNLDMSVAAVVVYDRALSVSERQQVETYLTQKYLVTGPDVVAPVVDAGQVFSVSEVAGVGDVVGTVSASDAVGVTGFSIVGGDPAGLFAVDAGGVLTVAGPLVAGEQLVLAVEAVDAAGNVGPGSVTVDVVSADVVAPVVDAGQVFSVSEVAGVGDVVGTVSASDAVGVTGFSIVGGDPAGFVLLLMLVVC